MKKRYKSLVLFCYSFIIFFIYFDGLINKLIHPRMHIFVFLTGIILLLFAIINLFKKEMGDNSIILIIPIFLFLFVNSGDLSENMIKNKGMDIGASDNISINDEIENININNDIIDESEIIVVDDKNFIYMASDIAVNLENYIGKTIEYVGFVYRDNTISDNDFIIGRMAMVCCSADTYLTGYLGIINDYKQLETGKWYKVKAVISKSYYGKARVPYLKFYYYQEIEKPIDEYVY